MLLRNAPNLALLLMPPEAALTLMLASAERFSPPATATPARSVEALGAYQCEGHVTVEQRVVREEDALLPAFAEEAPHLVTA